jgi:hypothetical protein
MYRDNRYPRRISDRRASIARTLAWILLWVSAICGALFDIQTTVQKYRRDTMDKFTPGLPSPSDAPQRVYVEWPSIAERV